MYTAFILKYQLFRGLKALAVLGFTCSLTIAPNQSAIAQQSNSQIFGSEILKSAPVKTTTGRYYYPDRLLVTFKKGVSGADVITQIINQRKESTPGVADLNVQLQMSNELLGLVSISPPKTEQERFGVQPDMILETARPKNSQRESNRSDNWLMSQLESSDKVERVTRDYVLFTHQSTSDTINDLLSGEPLKPVAPKPRDIKTLYPDDEFFKLQWHLKLNGKSESATTSPGASNFPMVWRATAGKTQPIIAVIDSGLYYDHEDIKNNKRLLPGFDFITNIRNAKDGDGVDNDPSDPGTGSEQGTCPTRGAEQDGWHGTHVAGLAGAVGSNNTRGTTGGSWHARIIPIRVLGRCGAGSLFDISRAMLWAGGISLPGVPDNLTPANIINLSLGAAIKCTASMQNIINRLTKRDVTIVTAAGNDASDVAGALPAGCRNVIAVAAGDARGHLTPYSNFGTSVDLMAPGGDLRRDDNGDKFADGMLSPVKGGYKFLQGTSQAAPIVAAAAALIKGQNPSFTPADILAKLKSTSLPRSKQQCSKPCGAGLLNLAPLAQLAGK